MSLRSMALIEQYILWGILNELLYLKLFGPYFSGSTLRNGTNITVYPGILSVQIKSVNF